MAKGKFTGGYSSHPGMIRAWKPQFQKRAAFTGPQVGAFSKGKGKGKGKGKVKGKDSPINDIDPALKVWIGGIAEGITWKELQAHFKEAGRITWAEVLPKKIGCVAFKTRAQATSAIATFNGSDLGGEAIEVDTWDKKPAKSSKGAGRSHAMAPRRGKGGHPTMAVSGARKGMAKGFVKGKGKGKGKDINDINPKVKVWVGNIAEGVTWNELQDHFKKAGKTTWAEILPKGVGCVAFRTTAHAKQAIELFNGSELGGQAIEVDTWEQKPAKAGKRIGKYVLKTGFLKKRQGKGLSKGKNQGKGKGRKKANPINGIDSKLRVWVGGLAEGMTEKDLKSHFEDAGELRCVQVLPKGQGCVAFKTESEAEAAVLVFNGSELKGKKIEVDAWEKTTKKEKIKEEKKEIATAVVKKSDEVAI